VATKLRGHGVMRDEEIVDYIGGALLFTLALKNSKFPVTLKNRGPLKSESD